MWHAPTPAAAVTFPMQDQGQRGNARWPCLAAPGCLIIVRLSIQKAEKLIEQEARAAACLAAPISGFQRA